MTLRKINKRLSTLISAATFAICALFSTGTLAGDEPVNCQTQLVGDQSVYGGYASCWVSFRRDDGFYDQEYLTQYVPDTTSPTVYISQIVFVGGSSYHLSCNASVPFSHTQPVYQQVCEYTPKVTLQVYQNSIYSTTVYANTSDRDGSVTKIEWWVDGVKQSNTGSSINLTRPGRVPPFSHVVQVRVTDNDGHTDTVSKTAAFRNGMGNNCGNKRC